MTRAAGQICLGADKWIPTWAQDGTLRPLMCPREPGYFRAIAAAPGFQDAISVPVGPITVPEPEALPEFTRFDVGWAHGQWHFSAEFGADVSDLRVHVQSTLSPSDESSWQELPGLSQMSRLDRTFTLDRIDLPPGD